METPNTLPYAEFLKTLPRNGLHCSVTSRHIQPDFSPEAYLALYFFGLQRNQIDTVFGSTTQYSPLYGGRPWSPTHSLNNAQIAWLRDHDIGLALTLTNHYFDEDGYRESLPLLREHHRRGNTIICTNDDLARRIRQDFPEYRLNASLIKHLNTRKKIEQALKLYDYAVLPMDLNDDCAFLSALPEKDRIILFGDATCAYTCPARTCYAGISRKNRGETPKQAICSQGRIARENPGYVTFNIHTLQEMGFSHFKFVSYLSPGRQSAAHAVSHNWFIRTQTKDRPLIKICSFPKSGRTWLRYILAVYMNRRLGLPGKVTLRSMFHYLPNDTTDNVKGTGGYALSDHPDLPLILFSHALPNTQKETGQSEDSPTILIIRDVAETLISFFYHCQYLEDAKAPPRDLQGFLPKALDRLIRYYNAWAPRLERNPPLIISYLDLQRDLTGTVTKVLKAVGLPVITADLEAAVAASDFTLMQAAETNAAIPGTKMLRDTPDSRRMRRGKSGQAIKELGAENIRMIAERLQAELHPTILAALGPQLIPQDYSPSAAQTPAMTGAQSR